MKLVAEVPAAPANLRATRLEISEEDGAIYLFSFTADGVCLGDTWHATVDEAKRQAQFQFGVAPDAWVAKDRCN